jgi:plastocyanin
VQLLFLAFCPAGKACGAWYMRLEYAKNKKAKPLNQKGGNMKTAKIFTAAAFMLCFACAAAQVQTQGGGRIAADQNAKETKIVRLHVTGGISPAEAVVKPGTTVIWANDSRAQLELQFQGKQVTLACKSPVHFTFNEDGSFISDRIPEDSAASLCFIEKGEFPYVLRPIGGKTYPSPADAIKEFRGKIIVQ